MTSLTLDELPPEVFDHIMFLLGSANPWSLNVCKAVSRSWYTRIMRSLWVEPNKQWGYIIGMRFMKTWEIKLPSEKLISKAVELEANAILPATVMKSLAGKLQNVSSLPRIRCAAMLANKGLLGSVKYLDLHNNLASVPIKNLASLVSSVTVQVEIQNVSGASVDKILQNVRCKNLETRTQRLDTNETKALVQAMETGVEFVLLRCQEGDGEHYPLDIEALTQYSGHGKCSLFVMWLCLANYREKLTAWAQSHDWQVIDGSNLQFVMEGR